MLELVAVLIVAGILAAVLAPRFIGGSGFTGQTTADKLLVAARYAETLAQNQGVVTTLTVGKKGTKTFFSVNKNGVPVADPTLQSSSFVTTVPANVSISPHTSVSFSRTESSASVTTPVIFTVTGTGPSISVHVTAAGYIYECQSVGACP